jgi:6-pyruvoyl-tetrahydropterin synthase
MSEFDWVDDIEESIYEGLKFRIPTNETLGNSIIEVYDVHLPTRTVTLSTVPMGHHKLSIKSANSFLKKGVWVVV